MQKGFVFGVLSAIGVIVVLGVVVLVTISLTGNQTPVTEIQDPISDSTPVGDPNPASSETPIPTTSTVSSTPPSVATPLPTVQPSPPPTSNPTQPPTPLTVQRATPTPTPEPTSVVPGWTSEELAECPAFGDSVAGLSECELAFKTLRESFSRPIDAPSGSLVRRMTVMWDFWEEGGDVTARERCEGLQEWQEHINDTLRVIQIHDRIDWQYWEVSTLLMRNNSRELESLCSSLDVLSSLLETPAPTASPEPTPLPTLVPTPKPTPAPTPIVTGWTTEELAECVTFAESDSGLSECEIAFKTLQENSPQLNDAESLEELRPQMASVLAIISELEDASQNSFSDEESSALCRKIPAWLSQVDETLGYIRNEDRYDWQVWEVLSLWIKNLLAKLKPACVAEGHLAPDTPDDIAEIEDTSLAGVIQRVKPSVVRIRGESSQGSGAVWQIDDDGSAYILTNHHVAVSDKLRVWITSDYMVRDHATYGSNDYVWADKERDLAILRVWREGGFPDLRPLALATQSPAEGADVFAMGYPVGADSVVVTKGIVSAHLWKDSIDAWWIQTDASINPGNSGGPLFNMAGEVVGINTIRVEETDSGRSVEGISFAVSHETLQQVLPSLEEIRDLVYSGGAWYRD